MSGDMKSDHPAVGDFVRDEDLPKPAREILDLLRQAKKIADENKYPFLSGFIHRSEKFPGLLGLQRVWCGDAPLLLFITKHITAVINCLRDLGSDQEKSSHVKH